MEDFHPAKTNKRTSIRICPAGAGEADPGLFLMLSGMAVPRASHSKAPLLVAGAGWLLSKDQSERLMQHGTAKHVVVEAGEDQPCLSIVAQAESKTAPQKNNGKSFFESYRLIRRFC